MDIEHGTNATAAEKKPAGILRRFLRRKGLPLRLLVLVVLLVGGYVAVRVVWLPGPAPVTGPALEEPSGGVPEAGPEQPAPGPGAAAEQERPPEAEGVRFVRTLAGVLEYELEERRFGWHPNSILSGKLHLTDNVRNLQLGVLETVRVVGRILKDKITRVGDADAFDPRLESAVNLFMISATQFWFPAADDEYRKGIAQIRSYLEDLSAGRVHFYPRSDNFEELVLSCRELLGNCHHNLVKQKEEDGSRVSTFVADDYFYYVKGMALAMSRIFEAALYDFREELALIKGANLMGEVVRALRTAADLAPWIVLNGDLDGILANHRADMAVPLGEALFKLNNMLRYGGGGQ